MMAQMELIHWGCKGKIEKSFTQSGPGKGVVTYDCLVCGTVFVYGNGGLDYWYKIGSDLPCIDDYPDVAELAREISCEGRVM